MGPDALLIAQISDIHLGNAAAAGAESNQNRLEMVLGRLEGMSRRPDLLLVSGDLADGDPSVCYKRLRERLNACPFPTHVALGNHDVRDAAAEAFGRPPGFFHYVVELPALRIVVLDTLEEGRHGGAFCAERAAWLAARLSEAPNRPSLIMLHHPPIATGIDWLTTSPDELWVARLGAALAEHGQVIGLICGHVHRGITGMFGRVPVLVCPSTAAPLALDPAPLDPAFPDGRVLVTTGPPGYALHIWENGLTSHVDFVGTETGLVSYDDKIQPLIKQMFVERP